MSTKSENAKKFIATLKEQIAELYIELAKLNKQKEAYDSVINNYGEIIKAFCATKDISQRDHLHDYIYSVAKENGHILGNINTNGFAFVNEENGGIAIEFLDFEYTCYYHNKFDIEDDFKHNNAFSKEGYDYIKFKLEKKINHLSELEQEYSHYYPLYLAIHKGLYDKYNDVASIPYNRLYKMYDNKTEYATKVNFDLGIPRKGKEESLNREEVLGLIKTILSVTECCIKNGIPLDFHIDDEYHFRIIE